VRIAHLSDLHMLDLMGAVPGRLFNKRATGYANLRFKRNHKHHPEPIFAARERLKAAGIDHIVVTGDVSNLALEREFDKVSDLLDSLHLGPNDVSVIPGNHDAYTRGAVKTSRFRAWFGRFMTSDLPSDHVFPYVRLRGPVAIIGLSSAVARPPLVASGELGKDQLDRFRAILAHPDVRDRTPIILQHHPIHNDPRRIKVWLEGLLDAEEEARILEGVHRGLVLHGHLHRRIHRLLETAHSTIPAVGSTSASLIDERPDRMAGFNVYEVTPSGEIAEITAERFTGRGGGFETTTVPAPNG
jgi:3',5'-cyclic AMP phosphodiesterase CpdA